MKGHIVNNRDLWDGWTEIHQSSSFYDLPAFRAGANTLNSIELEAVGDVAGKNLLHLQCHFGLDTLSWARLGAHVTGVDFSSRAIELASSLAVELGIDAAFTCADVCDLPAHWNSKFDIVITSYGVLPWLPDLLPWGRTIARVLRPGGSFHIVEFHPIATMLDDDGRHLRHPYFHTDEPMESAVEGSYADPAAPFTHTSFEWAHSLSEIQLALREARLEIQSFHEYPYSPYGCYPYLEQRSAGRWMVRDSEIDLPLVFRIHALRPPERP